ncbi:MAG TPA: hypothetical protein VII99_06235 [Bacteroidia bacterium]
MKQLLSFFISMFFCVALFGQTQTNPTSKSAVKSKESVYRCMKCDFTSNKAGKCPTDKIPTVKEGNYYCETDFFSQAKPGKCVKCKKMLVKLEPEPVQPKMEVTPVH